MTLFLLQVACFLAPIRFLRATDFFTWGDAFLYSATIAIVAKRFLHRELFVLPPLLIFAAAFFIVSSMGSYWLYGNSWNLLECSKLVAAAVIVPLTCAWVTDGNLRNIERLLWATLLGSCFPALIAVTSKFGVPFLGYFDEVAARGGRATGLTYHSNVLAYICAINLPVAFYFIKSAKNWLPRSVGVLTLLILSYSIILSGSRSGVLAGIIGLLPLVIYFIRTRSSPAGRLAAWLIVVFFGYCSLLLLATSGAGSFGETSGIQRLFFSSGGTAVADSARLSYLVHAFGEFLDRPFFGYGYEYLKGSHNHLVSILHSGGLIGGLGFILLLSWAILTCLTIHFLSHHGVASPGEKLLFTALFSCFLVWFISGALQPVMTERNGYILFGLLLSLKGRLLTAAAQTK